MRHNLLNQLAQRYRRLDSRLTLRVSLVYTSQIPGLVLGITMIPIERM